MTYLNKNVSITRTESLGTNIVSLIMLIMILIYTSSGFSQNCQRNDCKSLRSQTDEYGAGAFINPDRAALKLLKKSRRIATELQTWLDNQSCYDPCKEEKLGPIITIHLEPLNPDRGSCDDAGQSYTTTYTVTATGSSCDEAKAGLTDQVILDASNNANLPDPQNYCNGTDCSGYVTTTTNPNEIECEPDTANLDSLGNPLVYTATMTVIYTITCGDESDNYITQFHGWVEGIACINCTLDSIVEDSIQINDPIIISKSFTEKTSGSMSNNNYIEFGSPYPNPVNNILSIPISSSFEMNTANILIYDVMGRHVFESKRSEINSSNLNISISVSELQEGYYFFKVDINNRYTKTIKIVIQR